MESVLREYIQERIDELDEHILAKIEERKRLKIALGLCGVFANSGEAHTNTPPTPEKQPVGQNSGVSVDAGSRRKVVADYASETDTYRQVKDMLIKLEIHDLKTALTEEEILDLLGRGSQSYLNKIMRRMATVHDVARFKECKRYKYFIPREGQEHI